VNWTYEDVAKMIDHSLLNPTLKQEELEPGMQLAIDYNAASVCILPYYLKRCAEVLKGSTVKASTTIGFPHGGHTTAIKLAEAKQALADGGEELDMVVNISAVLSGAWDYVKQDIAAVTKATHDGGAKVKVIFENAYLNNEQKIRLCEIGSELNCDWVKTSTGYAPSGATMEDLTLMRKHAAPHIQVKAAGGVRDLETLLKVRALGVSRCGATRTAQMMEDARKQLGLAPIRLNPAPTPSGY
jgi:deoxyribose-phosphate aldolase